MRAADVSLRIRLGQEIDSCLPDLATVETWKCEMMSDGSEIARGFSSPPSLKQQPALNSATKLKGRTRQRPRHEKLKAGLA